MITESHPKCTAPGCCSPAQPAGDGLGRRDFLRLLGAGTTAALALAPWQWAMAGPFTREDFQKLVPADKKLSPEWVASLTARGERTRYAGRDLANIGMPIGGICAGQLYLGGDGKLWHWDIFNRKLNTGAEHYANPLKPSAPLEQGFALRVTVAGQTQDRPLKAGHWKEISFIGEYPIGYVSYADPDCPVRIDLEAFSPFTPLQVEDSALPATLFEFTCTNRGSVAVEAELGGWLENAVNLYSGARHSGVRRNRMRQDSAARSGALAFLDCSADDRLPASAQQPRPNITFDDFERETYGDWTATGTAFGSGPVEAAAMPAYQGQVGAQGKRLVNSHASAPGTSVEEKDKATGRLTSRTFTVERHYIHFLIGGGNHAGRTCMNLVVEDKVVLSATGAANNQLQPLSWDVREWQGKTAHLVIVDEETGPWGNIGIDDIVFSDTPRRAAGSLSDEEDFGTMGLGLLAAGAGDKAHAAVAVDQLPAGIFATPGPDNAVAQAPFGQKLVGSLARRFTLAPGKPVKVTFVLTWHFPNLKMNRLPTGRYYGARLKSAYDVAAYINSRHRELAGRTRLWHDTWYDSTLPYWFLDRTFLNTSILATSTCYRFGDGRFYSWEGVGCCEGSCGHVWHYAHAVARLFPELERYLREKVDFGFALQPDGAIHFRGEFNNIPAIDAQAGSILRALREHQMTADDAFLKRNWPQIRKAAEWLIAKDANNDGLIESNQHNTLDTDWFGPVAWLSGLYLAALLAAETMAVEAGDREFAARCRGIFDTGRHNLTTQLYDGEYFFSRVDPQHLEAINSGTGCEIDQVMGQSWAWQAGLPRVLPQPETLSALRSLWKYNFTPDVGPYRAVYKPGRWYAMPGEAGLLMCTFPRAGWDYDQAKGKGADWAAGYFNECMNGFEYQAAGHMVWEGLVTEGLAVTRAVHDRYHPSRRNPWNEVECGDHYVRSMASYGVFLAACGYEYHGPRGRLAFAPRVTPEDFKAPFTTAAGWGTYRQARKRSTQTHAVQIKYGHLDLKQFGLELPDGARRVRVQARVGGKTLAVTSAQNGARVELTFAGPVRLDEKSGLEITVGFQG